MRPWEQGPQGQGCWCAGVQSVCAGCLCTKCAVWPFSVLTCSLCIVSHKETFSSSINYELTLCGVFSVCVQFEHCLVYTHCVHCVHYIRSVHTMCSMCIMCTIYTVYTGCTLCIQCIQYVCAVCENKLVVYNQFCTVGRRDGNNDFSNH